MTQIKAVVFDIGNVLIEWQPEKLYDAQFGVDRRKEVFGTVDLHMMNDRVDRGENFREAIYETADQYPQFRKEILVWYNNWLEMAAPAISGSVGLLRALRSTEVPVFALTNFGIETFEIAEQAYPFLKEFDQRYISGHLACVKPYEEIYGFVERGCGVHPSELLFGNGMAINSETPMVGRAASWNMGC